MSDSSSDSGRHTNEQIIIDNLQEHLPRTQERRGKGHARKLHPSIEHELLSRIKNLVLDVKDFLEQGSPEYRAFMNQSGYAPTTLQNLLNGSRWFHLSDLVLLEILASRAKDPRSFLDKLRNSQTDKETSWVLSTIYERESVEAREGRDVLNILHRKPPQRDKNSGVAYANYVQEFHDLKVAQDNRDVQVDWPALRAKLMCLFSGRHIFFDIKLDEELKQRLKKKYDKPGKTSMDVIVFKAPRHLADIDGNTKNPPEIEEAIILGEIAARMAASYLDNGSWGKKIGLCGGMTMRRMAQCTNPYLPSYASTNFYSLLTAKHLNNAITRHPSNDIVQALSYAHEGCSAKPIDAKSNGIVSEECPSELYSQAYWREQEFDALLFTVHNFESYAAYGQKEPAIWSNKWLTPQHRAETALIFQNTLRDVNGNPVDEAVETQLNDLFVGMDVETFQHYTNNNRAHTVLVAGGRHKWRAVQSALNMGICNTLIIDSTIARELLNADKKPKIVPAK